MISIEALCSLGTGLDRSEVEQWIANAWLHVEGPPGRYRLRPAKLSLMSNESLWATCDGAELAIQEGARP